MPTTVPLRAILGSGRISAGEIADLEPGDAIILDREVEEPLRVSVGNCERFAGFAGTRGRKMALQLNGVVDDDGWVKPFEEVRE